MLIWSLVVLKYYLFVESALKNGHQAVHEKKKHFRQANCRKPFEQKFSEVSSVQPAETMREPQT